jgi:hypothetical protein
MAGLFFLALIQAPAKMNTLILRDYEGDAKANKLLSRASKTRSEVTETNDLNDERCCWNRLDLLRKESAGG